MEQFREADRSWLKGYEGLDLEQVQELAKREKTWVRLVRHGDAQGINLDYRPERLTIFLTERGDLQDVRSG